VFAYPPPTPQPTLAGFIDWVYSAVGIPAQSLPTTSPFLGYAYNVALALVNLQLACVPGPIYMLSVYNLAADRLLNWAPDVNNPPYPYPMADNPQGLGFFAYIRSQWNLTGFIPGVISASNDEGTGQSLTVQKQLENLTIGQLANLNTPYGRQYLAFAGDVGTLWGLTP
jgi:hypothetical protein